MYKLSDYSLSGEKGTMLDTSLVLETATLVCTVAGRNFTKVNTGWSLVAYWEVSGSYGGPMIVSPVSAAVTYNAAGGDYNSAGSVVYDAVTYYYSATSAFMDAKGGDTSSAHRIKLNATVLALAATELLDRYFHKNGF